MGHLAVAGRSIPCLVVAGSSPRFAADSRRIVAGPAEGIVDCKRALGPMGLGRRRSTTAAPRCGG